jgi:hypothetical protein
MPIGEEESIPLLWALFSLWPTESERLLSPKETLKRAWWEAANGTQETLGISRRKRKTGSLPTYTVIAVWRGYAMESSQVNPGLRYQEGKSCHKAQRLEGGVGITVSVRCLQLVVKITTR